jgi:hypothetical protein
MVNRAKWLDTCVSMSKPVLWSNPWLHVCELEVGKVNAAPPGRGTTGQTSTMC